MRVRELLTTEVITLEPHSKLRDAAELMVRHRIGTLPVVNAAGRVVGAVTTADLTPHPKAVPFSTEHLPALIEDYVDLPQLAAAYDAVRDVPVRDVMKPAVTVDADEDVALVAEMLSRRRGALIVVSGGRLVGVIARSDLLRLLAKPERRAA